MNKVVRHEHIPASLLPESLRGEIPSDATVTVTVTEEEARRDRPAATSTDRDFRLFWQHVDAAQRGRAQVSAEEAVRRVRALRDEWDD